MRRSHQIQSALQELDPVRGEARLKLAESEVEDALHRLKSSEGWVGGPALTEVGSSQLRVSPKPLRARALGGGGRWVVASTLGLALVVLAVVALLPGNEQPGNGALDRAMASAASAAAAHSPEASMPQQFRFLRTITAYRDTAVSGGVAWSTTEPRLIERWVAPHGSSRERIVSMGRGFASESDHFAWVEAGSPYIGEIGSDFNVRERRLSGRELGSVGGIAVADLPPDAEALGAIVEDAADASRGDIPAPAKAISLVGEILRDPAASGSQRRAAFLALAEMRGIEYLGERRDPLERRGEAVGVFSDYPGGRTEFALIYDPTVGQPLAFTERLMEPSTWLNTEVPAMIGVEVYLDQGQANSRRSLPRGVSRIDRTQIKELLSGILAEDPKSGEE